MYPIIGIASNNIWRNFVNLNLPLFRAHNKKSTVMSMSYNF